MTDGQKSEGLEARRAARCALLRTLQKGVDFDRTFDDFAAPLSGRDRAFMRTLGLTTLRRLGSLRRVLAHLLDKPFDPGAEAVEFALLIGLTQILLLDTEPHAAVDLAVEDVKQLKGPAKHMFGVANAVLRRAAREKADLQDRLAADPLSDLPDTVVARWAKTFDPQTLEVLALSLRPVPETDLSLKPGEDTQAWAETLKGAAVGQQTVRRPAGDITNLPGFEDGAWWVQDLAASLPVTLMGDLAGKRVLDLCAAPGGKTLQLASRGAEVVALDRSEARLKRLRDNLARTNLSAEIVLADALTYSPDLPFDAVLLDAPCSATGTFRRNPDGLWLKGGEDITRLAGLQARLLDHAVTLLKPGGMLLYCVCSMEREEGEDQWQAFLDRTPDVRAHGITAGDLGPLSAFSSPRGTLRTHPGQTPIMDGFFIARACKT